MMRKLFVVIHVNTLATTIKEATKIFENGADGIFLINHNFTHVKLIQIYMGLRKYFPDKFIGLNFLDLEPAEACELLPSGADALWTDNPCIEEVLEYQEYPLQVYTRLQQSQTLYFGGTAFKYQESVNDLVTATRASAAYMDVITTSGPKTGAAPDIEKIKRMAQYAHESGKELAIASGITSDNVESYKDADCFLVATGIGKGFYECDPVKLKELVKKIRNL